MSPQYPRPYAKDDPSKKRGYRLVGDADFAECSKVGHNDVTMVPCGFLRNQSIDTHKMVTSLVTDHYPPHVNLVYGNENACRITHSGLNSRLLCEWSLPRRVRFKLSFPYNSPLFSYRPCSKVAGFITPVPGGVGPMTIAILLQVGTENSARHVIGCHSSLLFLLLSLSPLCFRLSLPPLLVSLKK
jgi:hypothetical protein